MREVLEALSAALADGRDAVLVTVVGVQGEPPSRPGARLLVVDGTIAAGTIGCSEFDAAAVELAGELTAGTVTLRRSVTFAHGTEQVLDLFGERMSPAARVIVTGAGPVGRAVAQFAAAAGRGVLVLAEEDDPVARLRSKPPGPHDAVLVPDHDAPSAAQVLALALRSDAFFVGMLGSRRHAPAVLGTLEAEGIPAERLAGLHTPCGLDIGARTPEEIGLSIVAEIVATERGRPGGSLRASRPTAQSLP